DVAHKHLRRMGIEPEKGETGADDDKAKDDQELLILEKGDNAISGEGGRGDNAWQPVQPVGQRHRVGHAGNDEGGERYEPDANVDALGHSRQRHPALGAVEQVNGDGGDRGDDGLIPDLVAGQHTHTGALAEALVVVNATQNRIGDHDAEGYDDTFGNLHTAHKLHGVHDKADNYGPGDDKHAAHRRRAHLRKVRLRPFDADLLAQAQASHNLDERAAPDHRHQEGKTADCQCKSHLTSCSYLLGCASAETTASRPTLRDPLIS